MRVSITLTAELPDGRSADYYRWVENFAKYCASQFKHNHDASDVTETVRFERGQG